MPDIEAVEKDVGLRHYKCGRDSWKVGYSHYWLRLRGFVTAGVLTFATMGFPWWWNPKWGNLMIPDSITIRTSTAAQLSVAATIFILTLVFFYARRRAQKSVACKDKWHTISHTMRDSYCGLLERTGARRSKHNLGHEKRHLIESSNTIAQNIVDFYNTVTNCNCIGAAIRLAVDPPKDNTNQVFYTTVGRAGSVNQKRPDFSESIPATEGLPKLFRSKEIAGNGVAYVHDISTAIRHGLYKETINEKTFPSDYKYVIAVPLNGWNGRNRDLIGILTLTGRSPRILAVQHVDLLKAIGDRLAEHYSATVARLSASDCMPSFSPELN